MTAAPDTAMPAVDAVLTAGQVEATVAAVAAAQEPSGAIPAHSGAGALTDPWDHVECAMALSAGGRPGAAERAYAWLRAGQRADGSWAARYRRGLVVDPTTDLNQCAYVAVGVWHHWLVTADERFTRWMWPSVARALDLVVAAQTRRGEIPWVLGPGGKASFALLAGCCSIHHALRCGAALGAALGHPRPGWSAAADRLRRAITTHPGAFVPKRSFAMDWYYPVLGQALTGGPARHRLARDRAHFVVEDLGCRCVRENPWVTGAETAELSLALHAAGEPDPAAEQLAAMQHLRDERGGYWMGYEYVTRRRWPMLRSTWTAAAVVLAADALSGTTPGGGIFRGS